MKIFASRLLPADSVAPMIELGWAVDMYEHDRRCPRDEFLERSKDCDALLAQATDLIDKQVLDSARQLRVVSCCSIGYDHVDIRTAADRGVVVCNAPTADLIGTTAEAAVGLLLAVAKRIPRLHVQQGDGRLPPYSFVEPMGLPVRDRVSGIVGLGNIGSEIARIMKFGFGNSIKYFNRSTKLEQERSLGAEKCSLDKLLSTSDFVFVAIPRNEGTENLLGSSNLQHLKRDAVLVNVARAGIIDDQALIGMLANNRIFGAGLDVYDPTVAACTHPNLVLTAHMANGETWASRTVVNRAVSNIVAVLNDEEPISAVAAYGSDGG